MGTQDDLLAIAKAMGMELPESGTGKGPAKTKEQLAALRATGHYDEDTGKLRMSDAERRLKNSSTAGGRHDNGLPTRMMEGGKFETVKEKKNVKPSSKLYYGINPKSGKPRIRRGAELTDEEELGEVSKKMGEGK